MALLDFYNRPTAARAPRSQPAQLVDAYGAPVVAPGAAQGHVVAFDGMAAPVGVQSAMPDVLSTAQASQQWSQSAATRSGPSTYKSLPADLKPIRAPRTRFVDPLSLMYATGYKDRRFSISYDTLRKVSYQLGLLGAIINTRVNQVAAFAQPYRKNQQVGFQVKFKKHGYIPTESERIALEDLEGFLANCGAEDNPYTRDPRDDLETFLRKVTRDSLTYDQMTFEIIPDSHGRPAEFRATDAATIRLAATYDGRRDMDGDSRRLKSREDTDRWKDHHARAYGMRGDEEFDISGDNIYTVQVLHGRIENLYSHWDMAMCLRNPRTDIWVNGYGFGEIEMAMNSILGMMWAEEYNRRFFQQGAAPKGILNIKGENVSPEMMEAFRRQWYAMIAGVENSWRTPIIQAEGMEYQSLHSTNQEMEYQHWLEYLLKILTGIYLIDPSEINFDLAGGSSQNPMFESKHEWKIKHSRDKGLRPLLRFMARQLSKYVIDPIDSRLYVDFVGLDELSDQDRIELYVKRVTNIETPNELREEIGRPPLPGGDVILNQTFLTAWQEENAKWANPEGDMALWHTQGENSPPSYGDAPAIPLWRQTAPDPPPPGEEGEGGPPGGGAPGGPPGGGEE